MLQCHPPLHVDILALPGSTDRRGACTDMPSRSHCHSPPPPLPRPPSTLSLRAMRWMMPSSGMPLSTLTFGVWTPLFKRSRTPCRSCTSAPSPCTLAP